METRIQTKTLATLRSNARTRNSSEQTFDNFHNFRVNLPFRKPDIKGWANKHGETYSTENKRTEYKDSNVSAPKSRFQRGTEHSTSIEHRRKTHYETHGRYLRNTQYLPEEYIPSLTSTNVMGYYGGSGNKEAKQKALLIQKISRARHKKYGTLDPEYTLITNMKTMEGTITLQVATITVAKFFNDETYKLQTAPELTQLMSELYVSQSQSQEDWRKSF